MDNLPTKEELISFEDEIVKLWEAGEIHSPVHFSGGNEEPLIEIFKDIKEEDWVFSTHRSHYHFLLKGAGREWLKNEILSNRSIHLNSKHLKVFTSAIVSGILPIALGTALAIKLKKGKEKVWCFVGDMAAEMGAFHECEKYARRNNLPITFVIEDNGVSVDTPTQKTWGEWDANNKTLRYKYTRVYPHYGCGKWVLFR
jgi:TPP-dependent pyruvate/acetoin dehydrogenase alpha subunit